jgi:hypothetical protein
VHLSRRFTLIVVCAILLQATAPLVPPVTAKAISFTDGTNRAIPTTTSYIDGFWANHPSLVSANESRPSKEPYLLVIDKTDTNAPFRSSARARISSASSTAPNLDNRPLLPVIYQLSKQTVLAVSGESAAVRPAVAASQTITNAEDILYLVNRGQMARTRIFSAITPTWESIISPTSLIGGTTIYDFILDPSDPYHTAFAVGSTGIWRTTNLNDRWPDWQNVRSIYAITSSLPLGKYDPYAIVSRVAGDVVSPAITL